MPIPPENTPLGESISEIIDRTTTIVHEEIELAKSEVSIALQDLLRGSVAGIVGGVFAFFGLFVLLIAISFLVADAIGAWYPWLGFFIVAFVCFVVGGVLAFVALKKIKKGSQIAPTQAIDEARQTRDALQAESDEPVETIDAVAIEEPSAVATPTVVETPAEPDQQPAAEPVVIEGAVVEATEELEQARHEADDLQLDAKELKKRAKQEAKEAKAAAKAARAAEQEAAKAEAVAAKAAEKAQKEREKARAKAEKDAAKRSKKDAKAKQDVGEQPQSERPAASPEPSKYVPPSPPQQPPAQPPPKDSPTPDDPKRDN